MLETARLTLRKPQASDIPAWTEFFCTPRARFIGGGAEGDAGKAWRAFAAFIGHWDIHGFGIYTYCDKATGQPLGGCGIWFPGNWPERELGWTVWSPAHEGQGYVAEAARAVLSHLFHDLGWQTTVSYIDPANARSIALAERLGAVLDENAERPDPEDLVYRHPKPEAA
ncbi:MAG: GNAT family N-acetyltransferase [Pseudomonadota bacterium]